MVDGMTPPAATRVIDGRIEFKASLREGFEVLAQDERPEVWCCDRDFLEWPLGELQTVEQLTRWARPGRRLVVLAADFTLLAQRHPRWVEWRRRFSHLVHCRCVDPADADSIPSMLLAPPRLGVHLLDPLRLRGVHTSAAADIVTLRLQLETYLQRSHESFPATTLGL